jgi:RimJ/RimL family protein N-acetyltransferase
MLKGTKVQLRLIDHNDLEQIVKWRNSNFEYFYEYPLSMAKQPEWFELYLKSNSLLFIIEGDDKKVGMVGISNIDHKNRHAEFGRFLIAPVHKGSGYGREALNLMLEYGFNYLNLNKIYLDTFEDSDSARTLYEAVGFKISGHKREHIFREKYHDLICMELMRKDYKKPL